MDRPSWRGRQVDFFRGRRTHWTAEVLGDLHQIRYIHWHVGSYPDVVAYAATHIHRVPLRLLDAFRRRGYFCFRGHGLFSMLIVWPAVKAVTSAGRSF